MGPPPSPQSTGFNQDSFDAQTALTEERFHADLGEVLDNSRMIVLLKVSQCLNVVPVQQDIGRPSFDIGDHDNGP